MTTNLTVLEIPIKEGCLSHNSIATRPDTQFKSHERGRNFVALVTISENTKVGYRLHHFKRTGIPGIYQLPLDITGHTILCVGSDYSTGSGRTRKNREFLTIEQVIKINDKISNLVCSAGFKKLKDVSEHLASRNGSFKSKERHAVLLTAAQMKILIQEIAQSNRSEDLSQISQTLENALAEN